MAIRGMAGVLWVAGTAAVVNAPAEMPLGAVSPAAPAAGAVVPRLPLRIVVTAGAAGLRPVVGFPCSR